MTHTVRNFYHRENPISAQGVEFTDEVVEGASVEYKFGYSGNIATSEVTIWPDTSLYVFPVTAVTMNVSSTSNTDQTGGGGATAVHIEGLDANYDEITEFVNTAGVAGVSTNQQFLRINRVHVTNAEANATNAGDIYVGTGAITSGVPDIFYANVEAGEAQTLQAVFTIPSNKTVFITGITASQGKSGNDAIFRFKQRNIGGVFRLLDKFVLQQNSLTIPHSPPVKIEEKTDLMATAIATGGTVDASFVWTMILWTDEH